MVARKVSLVEAMKPTSTMVVAPTFKAAAKSSTMAVAKKLAKAEEVQCTSGNLVGLNVQFDTLVPGIRLVWLNGDVPAWFVCLRGDAPAKDPDPGLRSIEE